MSKSIALQALRRDLSRVIGEVTYGEQTYTIESYGRPVAVLLSIDAYRRLTAITLEPEARPARIISPRLANPAQAIDFELEVLAESSKEEAAVHA